ncbi:MAG: rod shape-determining protein MreD [Acidobacteriota bacterium]|nr:rod shape-determining protein MreD [Acidobacteriota bacterium]
MDDYPSGNRMMVSSARQVRSATYPVWVYFLVSGLALLIQVYLPLFETLRFVSRIELPLLVTIYFALMRRSQLRGLSIGVALGLAQDSLFQQPIGMYGICKTLVGYFSASIGMQFDVEHAFVRLVLCFVFYLFHQFFYWVLQRSLLDQAVLFDIQTELILAVLNAVIGVALFHFLDKLRHRE